MSEKQPLFIKISNSLLQDIRAGKFKEILPAEQELASFYGVSRPTVRSALQKLNDENVVTTLHGRGTFITKLTPDFRLRIDKLKGFYPLLADAGHKVGLEEVGHEFIQSFKADYKLPNEFFDHPVLMIKRILSCEGVPTIYIEECFPEVYLKTKDFSKLPNSVYDVVAKLTNHRIKYTVSEFLPVLPPVYVANKFSITRQDPIFLVKETHFNMLNNIMVYSQVYINSNNRQINLAVIRTR